VDSRPTAACAVFAWDLDGCAVETIEGFADGEELSPEQQAFVDCGAFQCGFCTSGMVTLTTALLRDEPEPSEERIVEYMSSNICRCTGYKMIIEAVEAAAATRSEEASK
jgi:carbon-monoxide dehydrogenase small subunit